MELMTLRQQFKDPVFQFLTIEDLDIDESVIEQCVELFQRFVGLDDESDPQLLAASETDVREDAIFCLALMQAPADFLMWFLEEDFSIYEMTLTTGSEEWAKGVIDCARSLCVLHAELTYQ